MNLTFFNFLMLLGSLSLFLFGIKYMGESLQKVSGNRLKKFLDAVTHKRVPGMVTGITLTSLIQSSSATTLMLVSLVNAGALTLAHAASVALGVNIGATSTLWLISILGFKVNLTLFALPIIGLSLPFWFVKNQNLKSIGEFILGFGVLFLSLKLLKESLPALDTDSQFFNFLSKYTNMGFWSVILFVAIGTAITLIIQSSSATMAFTLVLCYQGWIGYETAAALILGENIGTTIVVNFGASMANNDGKRLARIHFMINLIGVIWMLVLFYPFLIGIEKVMIAFKGQSPFENPGALPVSLALFHSVFNILNAFILFGFMDRIIRISKSIVPDTNVAKEAYSLKYIDTGALSTSEISLIQARNEITSYSEIVLNMFDNTRSLLRPDKDMDIERKFNEIKDTENIADTIELEISNYLTRASENRLSPEGSLKVKSMIGIISYIEDMADSCYKIAVIFKRKNESQVKFQPFMMDNIELMFNLVYEALNILNTNLKSESPGLNIQRAGYIKNEISSFRNQVRSEHYSNLEKHTYDFKTGALYNDIFSECDKIGDFSIRISESIAGSNVRP